MGVRRYHKGAGGLHGNSGTALLDTRLPRAAASSLKYPSCDKEGGGQRSQEEDQEVGHGLRFVRVFLRLVPCALRRAMEEE